MKEPGKFVPNVHFELIPIKNLVSNQNYQRNLSVQHIRRTVDNFDLYQVNPVKVSRRDGVNHVFNGQHTIEIIASVSGDRKTPVWCMVYDDLDYQHEADIFANQQKHVKPLNPYEVFMANVEAGNDEQLIIKDLVESYKLKITGQKIAGGICAIATLELICRQHGFQVLDRTLRLCIATWEGEADSLSASILKAVARLVATFGDDIKDDIFKEKVGQCSARMIGRSAKERNAGTLGYADAMLDIYNKMMKSPLKSAELRATKPV